MLGRPVIANVSLPKGVSSVSWLVLPTVNSSFTTGDNEDYALDTGGPIDCALITDIDDHKPGENKNEYPSAHLQRVCFISLYISK